MKLLVYFYIFIIVNIIFSILIMCNLGDGILILITVV